TAPAVPPATLPALFQAQAERTPDAVAVVFGDTELTYRQLDQRANQLAHHLIGLGVGPEQIAALAMPRSDLMIVALLAVLKAGGAYLPVDPDYPAGRIEMMLTDASATCLLTVSGTDLPATSTPVILLDQADLTTHPATSPT